MDHTVKILADAAKKLPPDRQAELIDVLIEGLSQTAHDWNAAWIAEAERRWALVKTGAMQTFTADHVLTDIAAHLAKRRGTK